MACSDPGIGIHSSRVFTYASESSLMTPSRSSTISFNGLAKCGNIGDAKEQSSQTGQQGIAVGTYRSVLGIDQYRLEESVHRRAQVRQALERFAILARLGQRLHGLFGLLQRQIGRAACRERGAKPGGGALVLHTTQEAGGRG